MLLSPELTARAFRGCLGLGFMSRVFGHGLLHVRAGIECMDLSKEGCGDNSENPYPARLH